MFFVSDRYRSTAKGLQLMLCHRRKEPNKQIQINIRVKCEEESREVNWADAGR